MNCLMQFKILLYYVLVICGLQVATWFTCGLITLSVFRTCHRSYKCREAHGDYGLFGDRYQRSINEMGCHDFNSMHR